MSDRETARLARAYVVARQRQPHNHRLRQLRYDQLAAKVEEDLRLVKPLVDTEGAIAEPPARRDPYRDD